MKLNMIQNINEAMAFHGIDTDKVFTAENNCGTVWFVHDGETFFVSVGKCGDE